MIVRIGVTLVLFWLMACLLFFRIAIVRSWREIDLLETANIKGSLWEPYEQEIRQGSRWLREGGAEQVRITAEDGAKLMGRLILSPEARGTVLMMHGYRSKYLLDFCGVAPFYHKLGYNMLMVDQRAHGLSGGVFIGFGALEKNDCRLWCEYIEKRFGPGMPIFLSGVSAGASTVLLAAGLRLPDSVKGIVADCGFTSPWDILSYQFQRRYGLPPVLVMPVVAFLTRAIAGYSLKSSAVPEALSRTRIPVFFAHGLSDSIVPAGMTAENFEACASPKQVLYVEGAGHGSAYFIGRAAYQQALKAFLESCG